MTTEFHLFSDLKALRCLSNETNYSLRDIDSLQITADLSKRLPDILAAGRTAHTLQP